MYCVKYDWVLRMHVNIYSGIHQARAHTRLTAHPLYYDCRGNSGFDAGDFGQSGGEEEGAEGNRENREAPGVAQKYVRSISCEYRCVAPTSTLV